MWKREIYSSSGIFQRGKRIESPNEGYTELPMGFAVIEGYISFEVFIVSLDFIDWYE